MEPIQYELNTHKQFAELTPEQFSRMLPDFIAWHSLVRDAKNYGLSACGFIWVDDGRSGEIHSVNVYVESTGETHNLTNPSMKAE